MTVSEKIYIFGAQVSGNQFTTHLVVGYAQEDARQKVSVANPGKLIFDMGFIPFDIILKSYNEIKASNVPLADVSPKVEVTAATPEPEDVQLEAMAKMLKDRGWIEDYNKVTKKKYGKDTKDKSNPRP